MNGGQEFISPSNLESGFSSCDFHSIDEFSLNKSNISIRQMNFDSNNQRPRYEPRLNNRNNRDPDAFEYNAKREVNRRDRARVLRNNEAQRRVISICPKVEESKVSYVFKEVSSFDKSVEVPSSFLEPSIVFDEKDGKFSSTVKTNISKYNFKPIYASPASRKSIMKSRMPAWGQILPKTNESESLVACSFSD